MTITVEDGSNVTGANSYITLSEFEDYANARNVDLPEDKNVRESLVIKAADYTESFRGEFKGTKVERDQPLQWPRYGVTVEGFTILSTEIPIDLKRAQLQACVEYITTDMLPATGQNIKREKVDVIEVEYQDGDGSLQAPTFPKVDQHLSALLNFIGGSGIVRPLR